MRKTPRYATGEHWAKVKVHQEELRRAFKQRQWDGVASLIDAKMEQAKIALLDDLGYYD